ncbi:MAG: hypothetical protein K9L98_01350 [Candidatus Pacebacteria bacterium]|nr:hypothetical protein [Candidatus Paceibacterota bacterium]MCF7862638.1 hypothetical protein [Candidatus Paceibacterota bacterium]
MDNNPLEQNNFQGPSEIKKLDLKERIKLFNSFFQETLIKVNTVINVDIFELEKAFEDIGLTINLELDEIKFFDTIIKKKHFVVKDMKKYVDFLRTFNKDNLDNDTSFFLKNVFQSLLDVFFGVNDFMDGVKNIDEISDFLIIFHKLSDEYKRLNIFESVFSEGNEGLESSYNRYFSIIENLEKYNKLDCGELYLEALHKEMLPDSLFGFNIHFSLNTDYDMWCQGVLEGEEDDFWEDEGPDEDLIDDFNEDLDDEGPDEDLIDDFNEDLDEEDPDHDLYLNLDKYSSGGIGEGDEILGMENIYNYWLQTFKYFELEFKHKNNHELLREMVDHGISLINDDISFLQEKKIYFSPELKDLENREEFRKNKKASRFGRVFMVTVYLLMTLTKQKNNILNIKSKLD